MKNLKFRRKPSIFGITRRVDKICQFVVLSTLIITPLQAEVTKPMIYRGDAIELPITLSPDESISIMIDDQDATAFAVIAEGSIKINIPYPDKRAAFKINVIKLSDLSNIYSQSYRKERAYDLFDSVEVVTSGQLDGSYVEHNNTASGSDATTTTIDAESVLLALLTISGQRQSMSANLEIEGIHRTNPDNALRFNGPKSDISRFSFATGYQFEAGHRIFMNIGDTFMQSRNSLVNNGISSRGVVAGFASANDRFNFEVGHLYGADIVGAVHGPIAWTKESFRIGLSTSLRVINTESVGLTIHGSFLDVKRPQEDSFGIGQTQDGETNRVWGFGTTLGALNNRLRLESSWASSRYNNPVELNFFDSYYDQGYEVFSPGATKGTAWRHALNWDVWYRNSGNIPSSLSVEVNVERATPLFRSTQGMATADRRQWSAATNGSRGALSARISTNRFRNNLKNIISIHTLEESLHQADITLSLESLRYPEGDFEDYLGDDSYQDDYQLEDDSTEVQSNTTFSRRLLIPSSISINTQMADMKTLNGDDIILASVIAGFDFMNQTTQSIGLSAFWQGAYSMTSLEVNYSFLDNDQRERSSADRRDVYYGLSHDIQHEKWSFGGRIGFTNTDDLDLSSKSSNELIDWGLNATYLTPWGIDLSISFDDSRTRLNDKVFDERSESLSKRYAFSINAGAWLERKLNLNTQPSLSVAWQKTDSDDDSEYSWSKSSYTSTTINLGVTF